MKKLCNCKKFALIHNAQVWDGIRHSRKSPVSAGAHKVKICMVHDYLFILLVFGALVTNAFPDADTSGVMFFRQHVQWC